MESPENEVVADGVVETETKPEPTETAAEEIEVTFGDEKPTEEVHDSSTIKKLRAHTSEQSKKIRELERKLNEVAAPKEEDIGPKPTLAQCDYDEDRFESALNAWGQKKAAKDAKAAAEAEARKKVDEEWKNTVAAYEAKRTTAGLKGFEDAEAVTFTELSDVQRGILVHGASDPHVMVYALGRSPEKLKTLAAIKDPTKFAIAVGRMEANLKVTKRTPATPPEKGITGGGYKPNPADRFDVGGTFE